MRCSYPIVFALVLCAIQLSAQPPEQPATPAPTPPAVPAPPVQPPTQPLPPATPSVWKHVTRPDYGFGLLFYSFADSDTTPNNSVDERIDLTELGIFAGLNLPFTHAGKDVALGINPQVGIGVPVASSGFDGSVSVELAMLATLKFGTDASWEGSRFPLGATVGIGYHRVFFILPSTTLSFGLPEVMAEINVGKRRSALGLVKLRVNIMLGQADNELVVNSGVEHLYVKEYAIHFVMTPNY